MGFAEELIDLSACQDAIRWVGDKTFSQAWQECTRADWLLWYAAKKLTLERVVLAACACARTSLQYVPADELRPLRAIKAAEAWLRGEETIDAVRAAAHAAAYAAITTTNAAAFAAAAANAAAAAAYAAEAAAHAAAAAAYAAAYAGNATAAAANAAAAAAYAAAYAGNATAAAVNAAAAAAKKSAMADLADLVRSIIRIEEFEERR